MHFLFIITLPFFKTHTILVAWFGFQCSNMFVNDMQDAHEVNEVVTQQESEGFFPIS